LFQCLDLILHQRDQRRHDNRRAFTQQRRNLIAQRLAAARGHQYQAIAPGNYVVDDGFLFTAELGMAEDAVQGLAGSRGC
jgi:hypothetical protein